MTSIALYTIVTSMFYIIGGFAAYQNNKRRPGENTTRPTLVIIWIAIGMWGIYSLAVYFNSV